MTAEERDKLIDDLLEGDISEADFLRLEAEMIVNEEARKAYYDRQKLQTGLELEAEETFRRSRPSDAVPSSVLSGTKRKFQVDGIITAAFVAFAALMGVIGWKIGQDTRQLQSVGPVASGFGVVSEVSDAKWADELPLRNGDLIPPGEVRLESGIVHLELFSGVHLLVEGDAVFEIKSAMEMVLHRGTLQARVPDLAKGFRVKTPSGELVELGTEFSLVVGDEFESMQVIDGTIQWHESGKLVKELAAGEGIRRSRDGSITELHEAATAMRQVEGRFAQEKEQRRKTWAREIEKVRNDPRLLAFFSMDRAVKGEAALEDLSGAQNHGSIVRAARSSNRWGEPYGGLDFTPMGSRIRLAIEERPQSLTLMCWVKIDSLDRLYNSLFLTDGHELHEPHWQIMNDGRIFFSVKAVEEKGKPDKHIAFSPPIWTPARSGQWMHIATVYDGAAATTTHYVDGKAVSMDQIPGDLRVDTVSIGPASVANWSEPRHRTDPEFTVRNLNGTMDEFAIFGAALDATEIRNLYELGNP